MKINWDIFAKFLRIQRPKIKRLSFELDQQHTQSRGDKRKIGFGCISDNFEEFSWKTLLGQNEPWLTGQTRSDKRILLEYPKYIQNKNSKKNVHSPSLTQRYLSVIRPKTVSLKEQLFVKICVFFVRSDICWINKTSEAFLRIRTKLYSGIHFERSKYSSADLRNSKIVFVRSDIFFGCLNDFLCGRVNKTDILTYRYDTVDTFKYTIYLTIDRLMYTLYEYIFVKTKSMYFKTT